MTTTETMAIVYTTKNPQGILFHVDISNDGTAEDMVLLSDGASALGEFAGEVITRIDVGVGLGSILTQFFVLSADGGEILSWRGGESTAKQTRLPLKGNFAIKIERGFRLSINTGE